MDIEILEIAQKELDDAVLYYELVFPLLGTLIKNRKRQKWHFQEMAWAGNGIFVLFRQKKDLAKMLLGI